MCIFVTRVYVWPRTNGVAVCYHLIALMLCNLSTFVLVVG